MYDRRVIVRSNIVAAGIAVVALVVVACSSSGGGGTDVPASAPPASTAASPAATDVAPPATGACADSGDAPTVIVAIRDFAFLPDAATIKVGETVGWANKDGTAHTATLDDGDCTSGNLSADVGAGSLVFGEVGEYPYHCAIHPQMKGTITVTD